MRAWIGRESAKREADDRELTQLHRRIVTLRWLAAIVGAEVARIATVRNMPAFCACHVLRTPVQPSHVIAEIENSASTARDVSAERGAVTEPA